ncbi:MAG: phosphatidate cytidylyltransferase [Anaerolineales bacterium]|nr:phosphatidate cytidylyltransferase [Anaerolineales bacterium]
MNPDNKKYPSPSPVKSVSKETIYRTVTSLLLAPLLIFAVIWGGIPFLLLVTLGSIVSYLEISNMVEHGGFFPSKLLGSFAVILLIVGTYLQFKPILVLFTLLLISSLFWARRSPGALNDFTGNLSTTFLGVFYAGGLLSHAILLRELPTGYQLVLLAAFGTWTADTSAYFVGRKWGRHKLIPSVSPGKTWEGAVGGSLLSGLVILAASIAFGIQNIYYIIGLMVIIPLAVILGDITMSSVKRSVGVKDTGKILPGHGGVLDRIDGFIFAIPSVYYYVLIVATLMDFKVN